MDPSLKKQCCWTNRHVKKSFWTRIDISSTVILSYWAWISVQNWLNHVILKSLCFWRGLGRTVSALRLYLVTSLSRFLDLFLRPAQAALLVEQAVVFALQILPDPRHLISPWPNNSLKHFLELVRVFVMVSLGAPTQDIVLLDGLA